MVSLEALGWDGYFAEQWRAFEGKGWEPGRVMRQDRKGIVTATAGGERSAVPAGRLFHKAEEMEALPTVGDWVALRPGKEGQQWLIEAVLARKSCFRRKSAGARTDVQAVAANVDTVFLVSGLDGDYNLRRIERYYTLAQESGATAVVVLNKADLRPDAEACLAEVQKMMPEVRCCVTSAATGEGIEVLAAEMTTGRTAVMLGSSGVGKSSLINMLMGRQAQQTQTVREGDDRGRHTTTWRELFVLPEGGLILDTPGMRELQLWTEEENLESSFADVEALAARCRFRDCRHEQEPGCAVQAAVEAGELDGGRVANYRKLQAEWEDLEQRKNQREQMREKHRLKKVHKRNRDLLKGKRKDRE